MLPLLILAAEPTEAKAVIHAEVLPATASFRTTKGDDRRSRAFGTGFAGGVAFGFGLIPHPNLVLGLRVGAGVSRGHSTSDGTGSSGTTASIGLTPYLEVRPLPDQKVQPFVLVDGGVGYSWTASSGSVAYNAHALSPSAGGRLGLHAFVLPRLSIDLGVGLRHTWRIPVPSSYSVAAHGNTLVVQQERTRLLQLAVVLGVSGWF